MACFLLIEMAEAQKFSYNIASDTLNMSNRNRVNLACPDALDGVLKNFKGGGDFFCRLQFDFGGGDRFIRIMRIRDFM